MSHFSKALRDYAIDKDLTDTALSQTLSCDKALVSRILNDKQSVGAGTLSRMLVSLTAEEARGIINAYFQDELEAIRDGREEHARKGRGTLVDPRFRLTVSVEVP